MSAGRLEAGDYPKTQEPGDFSWSADILSALCILDRLFPCGLEVRAQSAFLDSLASDTTAARHNAGVTNLLEAGGLRMASERCTWPANRQSQYES
jgi:hypothetical protein